jgi:hypothetical protein
MNKIFLIVFCGILFYSCEQPVEQEDFPYEVKLVINGLLEPDKIINNIYIGRTLPVGVDFVKAFADLSDATGAIIDDSVFYPLRHISNGLYTTDSLTAVSGKKYLLIANWGDKTISAETTIPFMGDIKTIFLNNSARTVESDVVPYGNYSYGATWVILGTAGNVTTESNTFGNVVNGKEGVSSKIISQEIPAALFNNSSDRLGIRIYVYDRQFYNYYLTSGQDKLDDNSFGNLSGKISWNIKGDGIGMFIGRKDSVKALF